MDGDGRNMGKRQDGLSAPGKRQNSTGKNVGVTPGKTSEWSVVLPGKTSGWTGKNVGIGQILTRETDDREKRQDAVNNSHALPLQIASPRM